MDHTSDKPTSSTPFPTSESSSTSGQYSGGSSAGSTGGSSSMSSNRSDELLNRVVQGAHETIDRLAGTAAPHVHRLHEQVTHAGESLHLNGSDLSAMSDEWANSLRSTVREHPIAAMATALAVGMLVARITR